MQKRIRVILIILPILFLTLGLASCASQKDQQNIMVSTALASSQEIETQLQFSGVLLPAQTIDIASKINGQVTTLGSNVGSTVKTGDILLKLDTDSLNVQLAAAQAALQGAQAAAQAAQNQADISKVNLDSAQRNYDHSKALFDAGALSQSQLDDAQDKLTIAREQYANASGPALAQAQAAVNSSSANIKNLNLQISNAVITSPISGIITTQNISVGQNIMANSPLISLADTSTLKLKTTVEQDKVASLTLGQAMDITVDSYPEQVFPGTVTSLGPIALSTGEVFPLEISLKNDAGLLAGLSAHTSLVKKTQGLAIPAEALIEDNGESYVFVLADNKAAKRVVKTGPANGQAVIILDGLQEGERVAVSSLNVLTDGLAVNYQ
jgi:multidrug efflux pump subunit AcrA (membrane-fusion protein)